MAAIVAGIDAWMADERLLREKRNTVRKEVLSEGVVFTESRRLCVPTIMINFELFLQISLICVQVTKTELLKNYGSSKTRFM